MLRMWKATIMHKDTIGEQNKGCQLLQKGKVHESVMSKYCGNVPPINENYLACVESSHVGSFPVKCSLIFFITFNKSRIIVVGEVKALTSSLLTCAKHISAA